MSGRPSGVGRAVQRLTTASFADRVRANAPIGPLTTYRVGGKAAALVQLESPAEVVELAGLVAEFDVPMLVLGRGSNLLVSDSGFEGIAITLGPRFSDIEIVDQIVRSGGAVKLPVLARATVNAGLTGFEWAVGIPGSVGGAVRMNAGGHGADMSDSLVAATVADLRSGSVDIIDLVRLRFGYRTSSITESQMVIGVELRLAPGDTDQGRERMAEIVQWRRANQPGGQNAGSVFTNPPGQSAGKLIEDAGGKGLRIGTAMVSRRHANFIQADDGGSADDIFALMTRVVRMVHDFHGVELHAETRLVGFESLSESEG